MASKGTVLVVDDDPDILEAVAEILREEGFLVRTAKNAFQARGAIGKLPPDLVILDRKLPDADGLELCRELRSDARLAALPVLFLSTKASTEERISGLAVGADDYLGKPFSSAELVLRVMALLRRSAPPAAVAASRLASGELAVDPEARKAWLKDKPLHLTPREFDLLETFVERADKVLSRAFLLERVWGYEHGLELETRIVDSTISHLRGKMGSEGKRLVAVLHHGYRLEAPSAGR